MSQFVFLYRGGARSESPDGSWTAASPAEMQAVMQRWTTWLKDLAGKGFVKDPGQPLEPTGSVVSGKQKSVTDGPYAEKDLVGGYTLVEAKDLAHATELSMGCPIFDRGGAVEIRPVAKM
jgi:hypothetical protein